MAAEVPWSRFLGTSISSDGVPLTCFQTYIWNKWWRGLSNEELIWGGRETPILLDSQGDCVLEYREPERDLISWKSWGNQMITLLGIWMPIPSFNISKPLLDVMHPNTFRAHYQLSFALNSFFSLSLFYILAMATSIQFSMQLLFWMSLSDQCI